VGLAGCQAGRRRTACFTRDERRRAYLETVVLAADLYRQAERVAPCLGMAPEEVVEHGRLLWPRARVRGARTRRGIWEFVAPGSDPPGGTPMQDDSAQSEDAFAVGCPRCGGVVRITLDDLVDRRDATCPAGHRVPVHTCAGLDEVIVFLRDLVRLARRGPG